MQDNNLKIAFNYKYPDSPVLMVYEAFGSSLFGVEGGIRVKKTIVGDIAVELYSQLTGKSIPEIHKEAGNINWAAYGSALADSQLKFETNDKSNGSEIKLTNSKNLSRMVSEAEELSRKILGKEKTNDKSNGSEIKLTNSKNLSRMVSEAEELSRKILGKEKTNGTKL